MTGIGFLFLVLSVIVVSSEQDVSNDDWPTAPSIPTGTVCPQGTFENACFACSCVQGKVDCREKPRIVSCPKPLEAFDCPSECWQELPSARRTKILVCQGGTVPACTGPKPVCFERCELKQNNSRESDATLLKTKPYTGHRETRRPVVKENLRRAADDEEPAAEEAAPAEGDAATEGAPDTSGDAEKPAGDEEKPAGDEEKPAGDSDTTKEPDKSDGVTDKSGGDSGKSDDGEKKGEGKAEAADDDTVFDKKAIKELHDYIKEQIRDAGFIEKLKEAFEEFRTINEQMEEQEMIDNFKNKMIAELKSAEFRSAVKDALTKLQAS